jgi:EAL domain-containing protein (putative c-di-GMP-specific phosphodiesterase class I)
MQFRHLLEIDLRQALVADQFEVHYQSVVDLRTGLITGFEALLRWRHPERGLVSPAEFIPLAEEIGLIASIGEWVLRRACAEAAGWSQNIKVAVNLSVVQFRGGRRLAEMVAAVLHATGLPATRLELEITETAMLQETEESLATLHCLQTLGIGIALDDFGTGYSSLSHLRRFPFDRVKIDQSFVGELSRTENDCAVIVRAILGLCAGLGIAVTAEGVETEQQLEWLVAEGPIEVQGYLLSRPVRAEAVPALIETQAHRVVQAGLNA